MSRVLALLLALGVLLPCYVWYSAQPQQGLLAAGPAGLAPAAGAPPPPPPPPYLLLNASAPPPLEELSALPEDDDEALMDLRPFHWLLGGARPPACQPDARLEPYLALVLVHTAVEHVEHRRLIRDTWGAPRPGLLVRFLVGLPTGADASADADAEVEADRLQRQLLAEAAEHGDMVQGSFVDAYRNMTYKHAMALKWFASHCPSATYVLKVDDDVVVNAAVLLDFLGRALSPFGARRLLACTVIEGARPKRTWRSKWRVGFREYVPAAYPTYCAGWAVLYSPDVALALYREAQRESYFWIDDVLVTGVLARRLGLVHARWGEGLVLTRQELPPLLAGELKPSFMVGLWEDAGIELGADGDMQPLRALWSRIQNGTQPTAQPTTSSPEDAEVAAPSPLLPTPTVDHRVRRSQRDPSPGGRGLRVPAKA